MVTSLLLSSGQAAFGPLVESALDPVDVLLGAHSVAVFGEQDL